MQDEIKDEPPIGQLPADPAAAALEAKQQEAKIEGAVPPAEVPVRRMRRTESVQGIATQMDGVIRETHKVQQKIGEITQITSQRQRVGIVPVTQYREEEIRRLQNLQTINKALGDLNTSALITRAVGAVEESVVSFQPVRADPRTQGDIVEKTAFLLNTFKQEVATNSVLQRHPSLQQSLQHLINGLTLRDANPTELQVQTNFFIEKYLEDPTVPLVEKAVAAPIVISLRDIFTHIHQDSIPRIIAVMSAFSNGAVTIEQAREMLAEEYGYSMLIPKGIKVVCDGFEYCAKGTFSSFKWGGRMLKRGFQKLNIFDAINFRGKFNSYSNTRNFLSTIFSQPIVDTLMPGWLDIASYSFFKFGTLSLIGCAVMKYLLSFFYDVAQELHDEDQIKLEFRSALEHALNPEVLAEQNYLLRDTIAGSAHANQQLDQMLGVSITQQTRLQEMTGVQPITNYKPGLPEQAGLVRRRQSTAEANTQARRGRQEQNRASGMAAVLEEAEEQKDSPPPVAPAPAAPAVDPRIGVPGFDRFGQNPGSSGPSGRFSRGKSRSKPKRKSVRKSNRKCKSKSKRKSVRKSNRKCKSKSKRKSVHKSNRKPARKSKRKSVRKSNRKPARKSKK